MAKWRTIYDNMFIDIVSARVNYFVNILLIYFYIFAGANSDKCTNKTSQPIINSDRRQ